MWIQGLAVALPRIQAEWSISDRWIGAATSSIFAGMMLGSIAWGSCSDLYGRRFVFVRTLAITALFGVALRFAPSFFVACLLCFGIGTGVGGSMPIDGTLFIESIPTHLHFYLTALSVFFSLGSVVCAALALALLPNNSCTRTTPCTHDAPNTGWRHLVLALSAMTAVFACARIWPFRVLESPTYLVATDQLEDACSVLDGMSEANSIASGFTVRDMQRPQPMLAPDAPSNAQDAPDATEARAISDEAHHQEASEHDRLYTPDASSELHGPLLHTLPAFVAQPLHDLLVRSQPLFQPPHRRAVLLTWLLWALLSLAFTMFNAFYPMLLQRKLRTHGTEERKMLYDYLWYTLSSVPGSLLGTAMIQSPLGRTKSLALTLLATAAAQLLFLRTENATWIVAAGMGVSLAATAAYAILYGFTPSVFPAPIRGTACAMASALGRLTGIAAPLLAGALLQVHLALPIVTSLVLFGLCALTALLLPSKTRHTQL